MKTLLMLTVLLSSFTLLAASAKKEEVQNFKMTVTDKGFEPNELKVKPDIPVVLHITRKTNGTCAREIEVPAKKLKVDLPMDKEVTVNVGKLSKGTIKFGCSMEMMIGGVMFVQ